MPAPALTSCLYECVVTHRRVRPRVHAFEHRLVMLYADLDELPAVDRALRLLSYNRANLYSFRDRDYLPSGCAGDLKARVSAYLNARGRPLPEGAHVRLLTLPRVLGYIFNPISVYFCTDARERPICAIAEVGNTYRETKLYLLPALTCGRASDQATGAGRFRLRVPKEYYVSPFSSLDISFDFDCLLPDTTVQVHVEDWDGEDLTLVSHLCGRRVPLCDTQLLRFALKFPALTLKVITLIHWHALRLLLKRVPWHRKAEHPDRQREVLNPSAALISATGKEKHAH
jgi:DUF1365 family protein